MKFIKLPSTILFIVGIFFFYLGFRVNNYNLYLLIGGGLIMLIGFIPNFLIDRKEDIIINDAYQNWKNELIKNGNKINVDLNNVEIKSNNYQTEIEKSFNQLEKYKALDTLAGKDTREFKDINECVLIYEAEILNKKHTFKSSVIQKDIISLQFLLLNQKETFIYVDKFDSENYFFDLEFLS